MKMAGCSEGKHQDIGNYFEIYLFLKYCEVTCLSYSLRWCIKNVLTNTINRDCCYFYYSKSNESTKNNRFHSFLVNIEPNIIRIRMKCLFLASPFVPLTGLALADMCYDLPVNPFTNILSMSFHSFNLFL